MAFSHSTTTPEDDRRMTIRKSKLISILMIVVPAGGLVTAGLIDNALATAISLGFIASAMLIPWGVCRLIDE